jgi:quercetin dioxygenase-like cupin family protein
MQLMMSGLDTIPLMNQIVRQPELWGKDTYSKDYPDYPFKDTDTIYVRFTPNAKEWEPGKSDPHEAEWMDGYVHLPAVRPFIFGLMNKVEGERLGRVLINRLKPGGTIFSHTDPPLFTQYWSRYHIVLQSSPGCVFKVGEEQVQMRTGELWWFDNGKPHEVVNNSSLDRIHLIIDIRTFHIDARVATPTKTL